MMSEETVHMSILCEGCGEPLGEDMNKCVGKYERLPSGIEIMHVFHKRCAPRDIVHAQMREMARWN